jgi:hypothetical protein
MSEARDPTYADVCSFRSLLTAFRKARRAKRGKGGEPLFYRDLESNLLKLSRALRDRTYRPDPYRYFSLWNKKERVVSEASFRDRVVHHALVAAIEPTFERIFVSHSYACRQGKGSHAAVSRARKMARRHRYALKLDVHHYFESIDHAVLMRLLGEQVHDPDILWLCQTLLDGARRPELREGTEGRPRGLPIGNLTSQFWANVYLHPVDDLVSRRMGRGTYLRYMDDMLVFGPSKPELWEVAEAVSTMLTEDLRLRLKERATVLAPVTEGVGWLGFRVHPGTTRLDRQGRRRFARKVRRLEMRAASSPQAEDRAVARAASVFGHLAQADTYGLRRSVLDGQERG